MSDFDSILDRAGSELSDEGKLYPSGSYHLKNVGVSFSEFTGEDGREIEVCSMSYAVGDALEDVDQDELAEVANDVQGQRVWTRFTMDNSQNIAAFKKAIRAHGIDPNEPGTTLREQAKKCKGQEVIGYLGRHSYTRKNGEAVNENSVKSLALAA